ncbi:MAG: MBL fold metallo-hydrolase [Acidobacteriota bacterium]
MKEGCGPTRFQSYAPRYMIVPAPSRRTLPAVLLLSCFAALSQAASAASRTAPSAEARGRRILDKAVAALGGAERLATLDDWIVEGAGRENLSAELQGLSPDRPTWRPHEEKVAVRRAAGAVAWERHTPRNDMSLRWRRFIFTPDATGVVDWATRRARMGAAGSGSPAADREALMRRVPHVLLLEASRRAVRVTAAGQSSFDGAAHDVVEVELPDGIALTLAFARKPAVLSRAEYRAELPGLGSVPVVWTWRGWHRSAGAGLAPWRHTVDVAGTRFQEVEYSRYEPNAPDAAAMMEIPAELASPAPAAAAAPPPAPAGPATGEVAPGVHVAEARGFLVMFVELPEFVVVFDAPAQGIGLESIPASGQSTTSLVTTEFLARIEKTCPGKPIRYVVVSHHHGDHLGGAAAFAARDVTFLVSPGDAAAMRRAAGSPAAGAASAKIEVVASPRTISSGYRRLEVIPVGRNPHTDENLLVWLPSEKIVLEGDLFYYEEGVRFPPSGRETMNRFFGGWLSEKGLSPRAIYGVHYRGAAGPEALDRARGAVVSAPGSPGSPAP